MEHDEVGQQQTQQERTDVCAVVQAEVGKERIREVASWESHASKLIYADDSACAGRMDKMVFMILWARFS